MSITICDCSDTAIQDITPQPDCIEQLTQVQRAYFVKSGQIFADSQNSSNNVPATTSGLDFDTIAYWNVLGTATDDTHVVPAPLFAGDISLTAGTIITKGGGDNTTLNGSTQKTGTNPVDFTGRFDNLATQTVFDIRQLECNKNLGVFFVTSQGKIAVWQQRDSTKAFTGVYTSIPVQAFSLGSKDNQGFAQDDTNIMTFQIPANYDEYLTFVTPQDFEALTVNF